MAFHRLEHVKSRLAELDKMKAEHLIQHTRTMPQGEAVQNLQRTLSAPPPAGEGGQGAEGETQRTVTTQEGGVSGTGGTAGH